MSGPRLTADDVRGVFAIMPTPARPGADDQAAEPPGGDTVDHAETARAVRALIDDGVDAILTTGTFGECAIAHLTVRLGLRRRASAKADLASSVLPSSA